MESNEVETIKTKFNEICNEKARSVIIAVITQENSIMVYPSGVFADHVILGNIISKKALEAMLQPPAPVSPLSLAKRKGF